MKKFGILKVVSIICSVIGLMLSAYGLLVGVINIGNIGIIFIVPSVISLFIIFYDLLITVDEIKKGLIYSIINSIIKIVIIGSFIPSAIYDYKQKIENGVSDLDFSLLVIVGLTIITIPSIVNIFKLIKLKKDYVDEESNQLEAAAQPDENNDLI